MSLRSIPARRSVGEAPIFAALTLGVLLIDLLFGGATHGGALSSAVARIASLPLLGGALLRLPTARLNRVALAGVLVALMIVSTPVAQLIPLPPAIWASLPGHAGFAVDRTIAGLAPAWMPISLAPYDTFDALLATLPPLAMFLATLTLQPAERRAIALCVPVFAVIAVAFGLMQSLGGTLSPLRFYAETNSDSAVGFFANRNHQAALLVVSVAFTPLWIDAFDHVKRAPRGAGLFIAVAIEIALVVGIGITRSRAGVLLVGPAMIAGGLAIAVSSESRSGRRGALALLLASAFSAALVAIFAGEAVVSRFQVPLGADLRVRAAAAIARAGETFFPWGSGLETFAAAYRFFEPRSLVRVVYLNHAHNDWLEIWVETGALGVTIAVAFVVWWAWAILSALIGRSAARVRAAALVGGSVILLLMAHSTADYPLRTAALDCVFAFACGLLALGGWPALERHAERDASAALPARRTSMTA